MSMVCTKFGGSSNIALCEFVADSVDELLSDAPTTKRKGQNNFSDFDVGDVHFNVLLFMSFFPKFGGIHCFVIFCSNNRIFIQAE